MNNIIITGCGGMLGSNILSKLKTRKEFNIYALTSKVTQLKEKYKAQGNITIIRSIQEIPELSSGVCVHCAYPRENNGALLSEMILETENLLTVLASKGITTFINISSQSVYPQNSLDLKEEHSTVSPSNLYGFSKFSIENIVRLLAEQQGIHHINIRLGSLIHKDFRERIIYRFAEDILNGKDILVKLLRSQFSYMEVEDAANALIRLISTVQEGKHVSTLYNLGNADWMSLEEIAEECIRISQKFDISEVMVKHQESNDVFSNFINSSKFYDEFQWKPQHSMEDIIRTICEHKFSERR